MEELIGIGKGQYELMGLFGEFICDNFEVSEKDIDEMMEKFMNILSEEIKHQLKAM